MKTRPPKRAQLCKLLGVLIAMTLAEAPRTAASADIRTWAFEATVVSLDDPQDLFGDVRLGDTIRGDFAYDVAIASTTSSEGIEDYDHPLGFYGIRVAIENPRSGAMLRYEPQLQYSYLVSVFTDDSYRDESAIDFWQFSTPPHQGLSSLIFVDFSGPSVLNDTALPTDWSLDDWPFAAIYLGADNPLNGVIASIYTLTPLPPGDFTQEGVVDADDYSLWRSEFGATGFSTADGNRDGTVDAVDYAVWRENLGASLPAESSQPTPEPTATILACLATLIFAERQTSRPR